MKAPDYDICADMVRDLRLRVKWNGLNKRVFGTGSDDKISEFISVHTKEVAKQFQTVTENESKIKSAEETRTTTAENKSEKIENEKKSLQTIENLEEIRGYVTKDIKEPADKSEKIEKEKKSLQTIENLEEIRDYVKKNFKKLENPPHNDKSKIALLILDEKKNVVKEHSKFGLSEVFEFISRLG